jgi:NAD-dependent deacetylase
MRHLRTVHVVIATTAVGYGQVLFCESAAAGALLLASTAVVSPRAAAMALAACLVATIVARVRHYPMLEWSRGLYGYTAALVALFAASLLAPGVETWLGVLAASAVAPAVMRRTHRLLTPIDIPAVALPALVLTWLLVALLGTAAVTADTAPTRLLLGVVLALVATSIYSRLAAAAACLGAVSAAAVALVMGDGVHPGILWNAVPTAVAVGAVLVPWSSGAVLLAIAGSLAAGTLWWLVATPLAAIGVPALVAPFNAVTVVIVLLLRQPWFRRLVPGRPSALPLVAVRRPEQSAEQARARTRLVSLVAAAPKICVLTGAGVSTAAGLPDFRGPFGLGIRAQLITLDDFIASPVARTEYWRQEEAFLRLLERVRPASTHRALATLHREGRLSSIVTQNVDGLHQAAGVPAGLVIEMHGNLQHARCVDCGHRVPRATLSPRIAAGGETFYCPVCQGLVKGGSTMFGEHVDPVHLDAALRALLAADLLLVLGTSLSVSPAADMLRWAREGGIPVAIVNAMPTLYDEQAAVAVTGDAGPILEDAIA